MTNLTKNRDLKKHLSIQKTLIPLEWDKDHGYYKWKLEMEKELREVVSGPDIFVLTLKRILVEIKYENMMHFYENEEDVKPDPKWSDRKKDNLWMLIFMLTFLAIAFTLIIINK